MYCNKCGAALPSHGYICKNCGAMMDKKQIIAQKEYMREENKKIEVSLLSDKYSREPIVRNYEKPKENKFLGVIIIVVILIILVILAILKVM